MKNNKILIVQTKFINCEVKLVVLITELLSDLPCIVFMQFIKIQIEQIK